VLFKNGSNSTFNFLEVIDHSGGFIEEHQVIDFINNIDKQI
jgi:hypothetical protein